MAPSLTAWSRKFARDRALYQGAAGTARRCGRRSAARPSARKPRRAVPARDQPAVPAAGSPEALATLERLEQLIRGSAACTRSAATATWRCGTRRGRSSIPAGGQHQPGPAGELEHARGPLPHDRRRARTPRTAARHVAKLKTLPPRGRAQPPACSRTATSRPRRTSSARSC